MKYVADFDTKIAGIPCGITVTHYTYVKPWGGSVYTCPSELDYYGYTEFDYIVLDRKGYKAEWLANKLTSDDDKRILIEYVDNCLINEYDD